MVAFAGVAWAFAEGFSRPAAGPLQWLGDGLGVLAGVLWGATTLAIRATSLSQASAEKTLFYQLAVSALLLLAAASLGAAPLPDRLSALAWASLAFQTVIVSFASYLVWFWLIRHYPATPLASFTMLTPVFGLDPRRGAPRRAGDRAPADRARDRRGRHLPRQPARAVTRILATIALRLAVCTGISWAVWRWFGLATMVPTLALFGILLARPLLDLAGALRDGMKQVAARCRRRPPLRVPRPQRSMSSRMPTGAAGCAWPTFARSSASPPATARSRSPTPTACVVSAARPKPT